MNRAKRKMKNTGFTFVEMLAAVLIGGFVALAAVSALQAITASREKIETNLTLAAELRFAANRLTEDLTNLYRDQRPEQVTLTAERQPETAFSATRLVLHRVAYRKARPDKPEGDVYEVEYFLEQRDEKTVFLRRYWPNPHPDHQPGGILQPIAQHIVAFDMRFYDGRDWTDEWPETMTRLPDLVDITLVAQSPNEKTSARHSVFIDFPRWPQPQIETMTSADAARP